MKKLQENKKIQRRCKDWKTFSS